MLDTLPKNIQVEAQALAERHARRLQKTAEHIHMKLLMAALQDGNDPVGAMHRELQDMRQLHERWMAAVREERLERKNGRSPAQ